MKESKLMKLGFFGNCRKKRCVGGGNGREKIRIWGEQKQNDVGTATGM
jgi:hypothetical protein